MRRIHRRSRPRRIVLLLVIILLLGVISASGSRSRSARRRLRSSSCADAGVIGFLSWAAILVLVNRFARPVSSSP